MKLRQKPTLSSINGTAPKGESVSHRGRNLDTKIVVGVDTNGAYSSSLDLIAKLKFESPRLTLLYAVNPACPIPNADAHVQATYAATIQNIGLQALDTAAGKAAGIDAKVNTGLGFGRAADAIMAEADKTGSDIVALSATKHGKWSAGYLGSATCALALNADQCLLVAKKPRGKSDQLKAVFAIDHSAKTDEVLRKFLDLAPRGIDRILIVSAYDIDDETAANLHKSLPMLGGDIERSLKEDVKAKTQEVVDLLKKNEYSVESKVVRGAPSTAIEEAMKEFRAELLIIGSTGAGSALGAKIGSIAMHQISSEPYSVLMLR